VHPAPDDRSGPDDTTSSAADPGPPPGVDDGRRPLAGIRVVDLTRIVAGPNVTYYLASLGADVIRVEPPGGETSWRTPPYVGPDGEHDGPPGPQDLALSPLRRARGKRSVVLDLRTDGGRAAFLRVVASSDVLVENLAPGSLDRLGLGVDVLERTNPRLVRCSVTGWGSDGPWRDKPAMDPVVQGESGLMAKTGFPDGPPTRVGVTIGDQVPAVFAALGVVAAVLQRHRDGIVRHVDVAMLDVLVSLLWDEPVDLYEAQGRPERIGNGDTRGGPFNTYRARDGWVVLSVLSDELWARVARLIERPDLARPWALVADRARDLPAVDAVMGAWIAARTVDEAVAALEAIDVPVGRVNAPWSARDHPQVVARGSLEVLHDAAGAATRYLGPVLPVRLSGADVGLGHAEALGASTEIVLGELGYDAAAIAALRAEGALGHKHPGPSGPRSGGDQGPSGPRSGGDQGPSGPRSGGDQGPSGPRSGTN
jgi:crotonobetainyl-CoA:carnitine CoA-transferase CaiB-like acyl-CoA transferase